jgi:hypothetical protein
MKLRNLLFKTLSIVAFFILLFAYCRAQDYNSPSIPSLIPGLEEQIDMTVNPQNPVPGQAVSITLGAYGTDLNRADISWLVNGVVQKNGIGATEYDFTAGPSGSVNTIQAMVLPLNGTKVTKSITIAPASVDIVWEANSYVPPFYKVKRLYPPEGTLTFVALPNLVDNGVAVDPSTLVYKWSMNNSVLGSKSGYGKRTLSVTGDVLDQPISITVQASLVKDNVVGNGTITVVPQTPSLLLYENNPLYGILFNNALTNQYNLAGSEVDISAYPYYFSVNSPSDSTINYTWNVNNSPISLSPHQNDVIFRKPDGASGQSAISVSATNPRNFLQTATAPNLMINFQATSTQNVTF